MGVRVRVSSLRLLRLGMGIRVGVRVSTSFSLTMSSRHWYTCLLGFGFGVRVRVRGSSSGSGMRVRVRGGGGAVPGVDQELQVLLAAGLPLGDRLLRRLLALLGGLVTRVQLHRSAWAHARALRVLRSGGGDAGGEWGSGA